MADKTGDDTFTELFGGESSWAPEGDEAPPDEDPPAEEDAQEENARRADASGAGAAEPTDGEDQPDGGPESAPPPDASPERAATEAPGSGQEGAPDSETERSGPEAPPQSESTAAGSEDSGQDRSEKGSEASEGENGEQSPRDRWPNLKMRQRTDGSWVSRLDVYLKPSVAKGIKVKAELEDTSRSELVARVLEKEGLDYDSVIAELADKA